MTSASPDAPVAPRKAPSRICTSSIGALLCCSMTFTVKRCCGDGTIAAVNSAVVPSCGSARPAGANRTDHRLKPSSAGAGKCTSAQYVAVVPGHGASRSRPRATIVSLLSTIAISRPLSSALAADLAPTLIANRSPFTIGEGMSQTARLVPCGIALTVRDSEQDSCRTSVASCGPNSMVKLCGPTLGRTSSAISPPSLMWQVAPVAVVSSARLIVSGRLCRSQPAAHVSLIFNTRSVPAVTSAGAGSLSSIAVEWVAVTTPTTTEPAWLPSRRPACSVPCGDAPESQAAGKAVLGEAALSLARAIEARDALPANIHLLAVGVGAETRERVVQDRRRPGRVERRLLDFVERRRLFEVGIGARRH